MVKYAIIENYNLVNYEDSDYNNSTINDLGIVESADEAKDLINKRIKKIIKDSEFNFLTEDDYKIFKKELKNNLTFMPTDLKKLKVGSLLKEFSYSIISDYSGEISYIYSLIRLS